MKKTELEKYIDKLKKNIEDLTNNNKFLLKQQKELTKLAEKSGSEAAKWKHNTIRLEDENKHLKSQIETMRLIKK